MTPKEQEIKPGQIWLSNDARDVYPQICILWVDGDYAYVRHLFSERHTRIALRRLRQGGRRGYSLKKEEP